MYCVIPTALVTWRVHNLYSMWEYVQNLINASFVKRQWYLQYRIEDVNRYPICALVSVYKVKKPLLQKNELKNYIDFLGVSDIASFFMTLHLQKLFDKTVNVKIVFISNFKVNPEVNRKLLFGPFHNFWIFDGSLETL